MVSGWSALFQGILKSPRMLMFLEFLSRVEMRSGNSSRKVNIVVGHFVEYGALYIVEKRYSLVEMFRIIVSDSKGV